MMPVLRSLVKATLFVPPRTVQITRVAARRSKPPLMLSGRDLTWQPVRLEWALRLAVTQCTRSPRGCGTQIVTLYAKPEREPDAKIRSARAGRAPAVRHLVPAGGRRRRSRPRPRPPLRPSARPPLNHSDQRGRAGPR